MLPEFFSTRGYLMSQSKKPASRQRRTVKRAKGSSKLASYAVTASGVALALGGANLAEAGIITGPLSVETGGNVFFDIPGSSDPLVSGLEIQNNYSDNYSNYYSFLRSGVGSGFQWMIAPGFGGLIVDASTSTLINGDTQSFLSPGAKGYLAGGSSNLLPRSGFVGFRVNNAATGGTIQNPVYWYGWLEVEVTGNQGNDGFTTKITAYGYDNEGNSILAGQTAIPEPSGLAMVALGGLAVAGRRWRRIGQKAAG
jgi:hypothetical protein